MTAAGVADFGGFNVVLSIWLDEAQRPEAVDQLAARLGPCKALKKFLQHKAGGKDLVAAIQSVAKRVDLRPCSFKVTAKGE